MTGARQILLNVRNQLGYIVGAVRAKLESLSGSHWTGRRKFPPAEPYN
jgi:hypothetical protein